MNQGQAHDLAFNSTRTVRPFSVGGGSTDPGDPRNRRYIEGQKLYVRECLPAEAATIAVDNNELSLPKIVRGEASTTYKLEKEFKE